MLGECFAICGHLIYSNYDRLKITIGQNRKFLLGRKNGLDLFEDSYLVSIFRKSFASSWTEISS
jgi:hypothetical protein